MRLSHFHAMQPVCPACRPGGCEVALSLEVVEDERAEDIRAGILRCENCGARYPILDGLPVLVRDVRRFVADNLFYLTMRGDLTPGVLALLAEASGPGGGLDAIRQHVSSYGWDHWADLDPAEQRGQLAEPGQVVRLLRRLLEALPGASSEAPVLDVGCGAGRSVAELAERTGRLTLGVDLSVPLARLARLALVDGRVAYDRRRSGLWFDHRQFDVPSNPLTDIWIADALSLPFASGSFGLLNALNLLDCVPDPRAAIAEFGRVLEPAASCLLATPFDWSAAATPVDNWFGGRGGPEAERGDAMMLSALLTNGPEAAGPLREIRPPEPAEWHVRLHDRSVMRYLAHLSWSVRAPEGLAP